MEGSPYTDVKCFSARSGRWSAQWGAQPNLNRAPVLLLLEAEFCQQFIEHGVVAMEDPAGFL